jgi:MOSC domain-containing protein YiiM
VGAALSLTKASLRYHPQVKGGSKKMADKAGVLSIYIGATTGGPMTAVDAVRAIAGKGLEGDRYANHSGTPLEKPGTGRDVTMIEIESLEAVKRDYGIDLEPVETRRNIITRGVALSHLVGREFRVGEVVLEGVRLAEPCMYLEGLTRPGVRKGLIHRGGLRTRIVSGGMVRAGDAVELCESTAKREDRTTS